MLSFLVTVVISAILAFFNRQMSRLDTRRLSLVSQRVLLASALRAYRSWIISRSQVVRISAYISFRQQFYRRRQYLLGSRATIFINVSASCISILIGSSPSACLSVVIQLIKDKILLISTYQGHCNLLSHQASPQGLRLGLINRILLGLISGVG